MCDTQNCQCQEMCKKMQNSSLSILVKHLKKCTDSVVAKDLLKNISNVIKSYQCLPATCLCARIKYVDASLYGASLLLPHSLSTSEQILIESLVTEIETFLNI